MRKNEPVSPDLSSGFNSPQIPWRGLGIGLSVVMALVVLSQAFVIVQAGERAVIFSNLSGIQLGPEFIDRVVRPQARSIAASLYPNVGTGKP